MQAQMETNTIITLVYDSILIIFFGIFLWNHSKIKKNHKEWVRMFNEIHNKKLTEIDKCLDKNDQFLQTKGDLKQPVGDLKEDKAS